MASVSTTKKTSLLWRSKRVSSQDQEEYVGDDEGLENEEAMLEKGHERRDKQYSLLGRWSALFSVVMGGLLIAGWVWIVMNRESTVESNKPPSLFFNGTVLFEPTVLLISLDGFRNDYLERNVTPTLTHFASKGIRAEYMQPSFPSMTFPNHWTLVTGLYPESHGIVANDFYDPSFATHFIHKQTNISLQPRWWGGEPIWTTATQQGKRSAVAMWPGSSVPHSYKAADYVVEYQRNVSATDKMDTVLGWLDLPFDKRPHMISVYIPQVDQKGHGGGPHGSQLNGVLSAMDKAVEHLLVGLQQRHLDQHIHTVIVSDHGMAATHASHLIYYDTILPRALLPYLRREAWPLLNLRPTQDAPAHTVEKAYQALYHYTQTHPHPHFQVYLRHQVPDRFHYMRTERIAPIVAIPDPGYSFVTEQEFNASLGAEYRPRGMHGYDPQAVDMRAIFMANGPIVRKEYGQGMVASFENVQLYEFLVYLLGLVPAPNNGTLHGRFNQYA